MSPERGPPGLLAAALLLGGCATSPSPYHDLIYQYGMVVEPSPARFSVCHRHSCAQIDEVGLRPDDWERVRGAFAGPVPDAAAERRRIAVAIAAMEQLVGPLIGAQHDRGGNLAGLGAGGSQLDCIDESSNSTTYLTLLERDGLLRWHTVAPRATRGFLASGWPHTTAVIHETATGAAWAVDSWFHDNGREPEIVPLAQWRKGWKPDGFGGF